jgi:hypothetical protein
MTPANPSEKARYRAALARLLESTAPELQYVAERMGVVLNTASRWQNDSDPRNPKPGWAAAVAGVAREAAESYRRKAADLEALATELEAESTTPLNPGGQPP